MGAKSPVPSGFRPASGGALLADALHRQPALFQRRRADPSGVIGEARDPETHAIPLAMAQLGWRPRHTELSDIVASAWAWHEASAAWLPDAKAQSLTGR